MTAASLRVVRRWLMITLVIGLIGTAAELLLLKHTDGLWQLAPIALIGLALLVVIWFGATRSGAALKTLRILMALFIASGGIGSLLHFRRNVTDEQDSRPAASGVELYGAALMGTTPSLAPGAMVQLGLIGLLFTYRHPSLVGDGEDTSRS